MIYRKIVCKETSKIMKNKELDNLRSKINNIDDEILSLLSNRSKIVLEIGKHKKDNSVVDLDRDCLLYTSPSPRDRTRSRMPSSA